MNRIDQIFSELKASNKKALMPYLTAGDPTMSVTKQLIPMIEQAGASICEIGFPFSDPIADGPIIQASMNHALEQGFTISNMMDTVKEVRSDVNIGLVAMVSFSITHRYGTETFIQNAKAAGFDGFIFPDLPIEEADEVKDLVASADMALSFLISPTTTDERAEAIAKACSGFVYVLSRSGLTGERSEIPASLATRLEQLKNVTDLPLAVGFGVSNAEQVHQVTRHADAAIVGSAIMKKIAGLRDHGEETILAETKQFVSELASGL